MLVLFVHGALVRDADWWWHRMPGPLAGHGLRTAAVELPSCVGRGDLAADAAAVAAAVRAAGEPVALVGHSYGGTVITEAGAGAAHLVYVTSVLAPAGRSHAESGSGRPVELSYREFELLAFLAEHPGRVFSRRQLVSSVWEGAAVGARTVDVHVRRLRMKLGRHADRITTVRNVGYRFEPGRADLETVA